MNEILLWILGFTLLNGIVAFAGAFTLALKPKTLKKIIFILVALSTGTLLGGGLLHLLPEAIEGLGVETAINYLLLGFIIFFLMEKLLHWHHCHNGGCKIHTFSHMILFGDALHNFIDGLIIAASFFVSIPFGIITTLVIIAHEIPQELGDFGVLIHGGFSKSKALFYNFISQLTAVLGGIVGYFFVQSSGLETLLLPFAAGGFIYIAASDLIPELHKEENTKRILFSFLFFMIGIIFMFLLKHFIGGH
jgi:zinc and cadmium transporter